jgi:alanine-glyoxylate transaminase / serine-glyoxylate transaminase / serine-pyruvate transaminase
MPPRAGRHFLQIPGPSNVPDRVLRAIDRPVIDHRGPEFAKLAGPILQGLKSVFKTMDPIVIYPASGTGAWEAALVNTLSLGDKVLMFETGHFATLWCQLAERLRSLTRRSRIVAPFLWENLSRAENWVFNTKKFKKERKQWEA